MIICIIFVLIVISDILDVLKQKPLRNIHSRNIFYQQVAVFLIVIVAIVFMGQLFDLKKEHLLSVSIMGILSYILILNHYLHYLNESQKFQDVSQFMLRMCIYFRIYQKSNTTLIESSKNAPSWIKKPCNQIVEGLKPLSKLLEILPHYLMQSLISVFESSESVGFSQTDQQLKRLEQDIETWATQTRLYQKEERKLQKRLLLLFGLGMLISYLAQNMLAKTVDVHDSNTYQNLVLVFISLTLLAIVYASKRMKQSWILKDECI